MLTRYRKGSAVARIYNLDEHKIDRSLIDRDAFRVIERLQEANFESYIVGGAVRDLMLGRIPKDFDVATAASPRQVHRLFSNARVIGRRFRLVHIVFGEKIIEVSTFRSDEEDANNVFGTIEQDAKRRDFSINSLYYDPKKQIVLDFNNSMKDFKRHVIHSILPLNSTFIEDPVRMIRAIKYSVTSDFSLPLTLKMAIRKYASELEKVSTSRMTEEVNKILASGSSSKIFQKLNSFKLLVYMLPCLSVYAKFPQLYESLTELDKKITMSKANAYSKISRGEMYKYLVSTLIAKNDEILTPDEAFHDIFRQMKVLISPITPANYELETACVLYMKENGMIIPKNAVKHRNPNALIRKKRFSPSLVKQQRRRKAQNRKESIGLHPSS